MSVHDFNFLSYILMLLRDDIIGCKKNTNTY